MRSKITQTLVMILFGLVIIANATTYYVSTNGNNDSTGTTEGTAWQTIKHAAQSITAGDTVYIKAGTYSKSSINMPSGVTFEGYKDTPGGVINIDWWDFHTNRSMDPCQNASIGWW